MLNPLAPLRADCAAVLVPAERQAALERIAARLGGRSPFLLVRDPEAHCLVPAAGTVRTLHGPIAWSSALPRLGTAGRHSFAASASDATPVLALVAPDATLALLVPGATPDDATLELLDETLPFWARVMVLEQEAISCGAKVALAESLARDARLIAGALDATRGDLQRALGESSRLNAQLAEADRRKNEFLAMLAHELRNPLSPISTALHLVDRKRERGEPIDHELRVIARQLEHLTRLVDDLLDVSRITRGRIELRRTRMDLRRAIERALETARPGIEARGHALAVDLELASGEEDAAVEGDLVRLQQVFTNLLNNAAKYTDPGGRISVSLARDDGSWLVRIADTGIGMSAETCANAFDLFTQAPRTLDRAQGGLGIGLSVVRALIEMHGGSVAASSDGEGLGSSFEVRLPRAAGPSPAVTPRAIETCVPPAQSSSPARPRREQILLVEDNVDAAATLAMVLEVWGHRVRVAHDGLGALHVALDGALDAVLLDIGLPGIDGFEVARRLRRSLPHVFLVAISGYGDPSFRARAKEAGFDTYLVKPVDVAALREALAAPANRSDTPPSSSQ